MSREVEEKRGRTFLLSVEEKLGMYLEGLGHGCKDGEVKSLTEVVQKLGDELVRSVLFHLTKNKEVEEKVIIRFLELVDKPVSNFVLTEDQKIEEANYLTFFYDVVCHNERYDLLMWLLVHGAKIEDFLEVPLGSQFSPIDFAMDHSGFRHFLEKTDLLKHIESNEGEDEEEDTDEFPKISFLMDSKNYQSVRSKEYLSLLNQNLSPSSMLWFGISIQDLSFRSKDYREFFSRVQKGFWTKLSSYYFLKSKMQIIVRYEETKPYSPSTTQKRKLTPYRIALGGYDDKKVIMELVYNKYAVPRSRVMKERLWTDEFFEDALQDVISAYVFYKTSHGRISEFLKVRFEKLFCCGSCESTKIADEVELTYSSHAQFKQGEIWDFEKVFRKFSKLVSSELPYILHRLKNKKKKKTQTTYNNNIEEDDYTPFRKLKIDLIWKRKERHLYYYPSYNNKEEEERRNDKDQFVYDHEKHTLKIQLDIQKILNVHNKNGWKKFYDRLFSLYLPEDERANYPSFTHQNSSLKQFLQDNVLHIEEQNCKIVVPSIANHQECRSFEHLFIEIFNNNNKKEVKICADDGNNSLFFKIFTEEGTIPKIQFYLRDEGKYRIRYYNKMKLGGDEDDFLLFFIREDRFELFDFKFDVKKRNNNGTNIQDHNDKKKKKIEGFFGRFYLGILMIDPRRVYSSKVRSLEFFVEFNPDPEETEGEEGDDDDDGQKPPTTLSLESQMEEVRNRKEWRVDFSDPSISQHFETATPFSLRIRVNGQYDHYLRNLVLVVHDSEDRIKLTEAIRLSKNKIWGSDFQRLIDECTRIGGGKKTAGLYHLVRLLHEMSSQAVPVENVLPPSLVERFISYHEKIQKEMKSQGDGGCCSLNFGYHGTPKTDVYENILREGLKVEYVKRAAYGKGIYLSPDPNTSVGYLGSNRKLLIVACIQGKVFRCKSGSTYQKEGVEKGFHSHCDNNERFCMVLFDNESMIPCFSIDLGAAVNQVAFTNDCKFKCVL